MPANRIEANVHDDQPRFEVLLPAPVADVPRALRVTAKQIICKALPKVTPSVVNTSLLLSVSAQPNYAKECRQIHSGCPELRSMYMVVASYGAETIGATVFSLVPKVRGSNDGSAWAVVVIFMAVDPCFRSKQIRGCGSEMLRAVNSIAVAMADNLVVISAATPRLAAARGIWWQRRFQGRKYHVIHSMAALQDHAGTIPPGLWMPWQIGASEETVSLIFLPLKALDTANHGLPRTRR